LTAGASDCRIIFMDRRRGGLAEGIVVVFSLWLVFADGTGAVTPFVDVDRGRLRRDGVGIALRKRETPPMTLLGEGAIWLLFWGTARVFAVDARDWGTLTSCSRLGEPNLEKSSRLMEFEAISTSSGERARLGV
jgi:hypothetical protein